LPKRPPPLEFLSPCKLKGDPGLLFENGYQLSHAHDFHQDAPVTYQLDSMLKYKDPDSFELFLAFLSYQLDLLDQILSYTNEKCEYV
jgi:hypothetical protein